MVRDSKLRNLFVFTICLLFTLPSLAVGQRDVRDLLRTIDKATRNVSTATFKAEVKGTGYLVTQKSIWIGEARTRKAQGESSLRGSFLMRGKVRSPDSATAVPYSLASNGEIVRLLSESEKTLHVGETDSKLMDKAYELYDVWVTFLHPTPFMDEVQAPLAELEGQAIVNGNRCNVIYVEYKKVKDEPQSRARWYFDVRDNLPRKVERIYTQNRREGTHTTTIWDLHVNVAVDETMLYLHAPLEYDRKYYGDVAKLRKIEPPGEVLPKTEAEFMKYAQKVSNSGDQRRYARLLAEGIKRGYADAMADLGAIYHMAGNYKGALQMYHAAAEKNHGLAMFLLAGMYQTGQGVKKSQTSYRYWLVKSAKTGCDYAVSRCIDEGISYE